MGIEIRPLQAEDRSEWLKLYESYLAFYEAEISAESKELVWQRVLSTEIRGLVAVLDGSIAGIAHFHIQLSTWADRGHLYLEDLFVDVGHRNMGIARSLIHAIESVAKFEKCSEMYWITREGNKTARALYDSVANATDFVRYEIKLN